MPEKSFLGKVAGFTVAYTKWVAAGRPTRDPEWRKEIFEEFCAKCEHYDPKGLTVLGDVGKCLDCGCHVDPDSDGFNNKLNDPLEGCSLDPPKFPAHVDDRGRPTPKPIKMRIGTINGLHPAEYMRRKNAEPTEPTDDQPDPG